jgi:hypothetical protein
MKTAAVVHPDSAPALAQPCPAAMTSEELVATINLTAALAPTIVVIAKSMLARFKKKKKKKARVKPRS